jgi:predicted DNA-binding transcriptional regulator YafY
VTLLFLLQQRRRATAAELAAALAVSERTVYRDIAALEAAGVPLWTEQGRAGGIRLMDGWRTRLDGLTGKEAAAIFALGVPDVLAELGLGAALTGARAKVLATLPAGLREYAARVSDRFHLDAPGWFHRPEEVSQLATIAEAVADTRRLRVRYGRRDHTVTRDLEPLGLVVKAGVWYLIARPVADEPHSAAGDGEPRSAGDGEPRPAGGGEPRAADGREPRTYRVARVEDAVAGESFERPDFDLGAWWARTSARFEQSLLRERVRLRLSPRARRMLPDVTDREAAAAALAVAGPPDADGWCEVDLDVESERVALTQLTALGVGVEILAPASLRAAMAEVGKDIAARHSAPL